MGGSGAYASCHRADASRAAGVLGDYPAGDSCRYAQLSTSGNARHCNDFINICRAGFRLTGFGVTISRAQQFRREALYVVAASKWLAGGVRFAPCKGKLKGVSRILQGGYVDQQLKQLMKELGEAINESLADSEPIADVVSRIKEGGYDIFLVLEATIGVSKPGEKSSEKPALMTTEFKISDQDLKFLKSLRIKVEDDAA
jgi:hypothetical protein